jgi:hypothetical protein
MVNAAMEPTAWEEALVNKATMREKRETDTDPYGDPIGVIRICGPIIIVRGIILIIPCLIFLAILAIVQIVAVNIGIILCFC